MSHNTKNYKEQGGDKWVVGGSLEINDGNGNFIDIVQEVGSMKATTANKATTIDLVSLGLKPGNSIPDTIYNSDLMQSLLQPELNASIFISSGDWRFYRPLPQIPKRCFLRGEGAGPTTLSYAGPKTDEFFITFSTSVDSGLEGIMLNLWQKCSGILNDGQSNDASSSNLIVNNVKISRAGKYGIWTKGIGGMWSNIAISSKVYGNLYYEKIDNFEPSGDYGFVIDSYDAVYSNIGIACFKKVGMVINRGFNKLTNIKTYVNHVGCKIGGEFEGTAYERIRTLNISNFESQENHSHNFIIENVRSSHIFLQSEMAGCIYKDDYPEITASPLLEKHPKLGWDENQEPMSHFIIKNCQGVNFKFSYEVHDSYANRWATERKVLNMDDAVVDNEIELNSSKFELIPTLYPVVTDIKNAFANKISVNGEPYDENMLEDRVFIKDLSDSFVAGSGVTISKINNNAFSFKVGLPADTASVSIPVTAHQGKDIAYSYYLSDTLNRFGVTHATSLSFVFKDASNNTYSGTYLISNPYLSKDRDVNKHVTGIIEYKNLIKDAAYSGFVKLGYTLDSMSLQHTATVSGYTGTEDALSFTLKNIKLSIKDSRIDNLLGYNGNFEFDSNKDGLGDLLETNMTYGRIKNFNVADNIQYAEADITNTSHYLQFFKTDSDVTGLVNPGDTLYACCLAKSTAGKAKLSILCKREAETYATGTSSATIGNTDYEFLSCILPIATVSAIPNFMVRVNINNSADAATYIGAGENVSVKKVLFVNLTRTYGKGNELSKAALDTLIAPILAKKYITKMPTA